MRRGAIVRVVTIGLLAAAAATAVAILIPWLPAQRSKEGERIDFVFWFVIAICIGVFSVVAAVTVYSVVRFRVRPDDDSDGPPIHGHTGLEIAWTAVPAVLVIAIAIVSTVALAENGKWHANRLKVEVTARQFAWSFKYPQYGGFQSGTLAPGRPAGRAPAARRCAVYLSLDAADGRGLSRDRGGSRGGACRCACGGFPRWSRAGNFRGSGAGGNRVSVPSIGRGRVEDARGAGG